MLYSEIIAVCSQIHTKHTNTLRGQNVVFCDVKPDGTYNDHWALKGVWLHIGLNVQKVESELSGRAIEVCYMSVPKKVNNSCFISFTLVGRFLKRIKVLKIP